MTIKGFGINADAAMLDGNLDLLRKHVEYYMEIGFDYVEIPVHGVGAMVGGQLITHRVEEVRRLLARFPMKYTVHGPNPLNLMDSKNIGWQKQAMMESIRFAAVLNSEVLVYHSGRYIPEEYFHIPRWNKNLKDKQKGELCKVEAEAISSLAEFAKTQGVNICMENARPYLDGSPYSYAEQLFLLIQQVKDINHPNVGITLDVGHGYLAAKHYGFNFLDAVKEAAPYIKHVHLHDNFGNPSTSLERKQAEMMASGRGDLHLPIGWGEIPIVSVFALLRDNEIIFVHEIRPRYQNYAKQALELGHKLMALQLPLAKTSETLTAIIAQ